MKRWVEVLPNKNVKVTVILESEEEAGEFAELLSDGVSMQVNMRREGCPNAMVELMREVVEGVGKVGAHLKEYANKAKTRIHS